MNVCKYVNCFKISYFGVSSKYLPLLCAVCQNDIDSTSKNIMQLTKYHLTWLNILCTQVIHQLMMISAGETV